MQEYSGADFMISTARVVELGLGRSAREGSCRCGGQLLRLLPMISTSLLQALGSPLLLSVLNLLTHF